MRKQLLIAAGATLIAMIATPALSSTKSAAQTGVAAAAASANLEEKKICKKLAASGTRLEKRTCLTKAEWKKLEDDR